MSPQAERAIERLTVENPIAAPLTLFVEPWCHEVLLAPGERVVVEAAGPAGLAGPEGWHLESWRGADAGGEHLVVWASDCWDARVLRADGSVAVDWFGVPIGSYRHLAPGVDAGAEPSRPDV